jgi:hypothetical protein
MRLRGTVVAVIANCALGSAHEPITTSLTWWEHVSRIVYKKCVSCHRPGDDGRGTFSLTTFEAARPWAKAIKEEVLLRRMPPGSIVGGFGDFADDPSLSQDEIDVIANWVEGGAPEGDRSLMPPLPPPVREARPATRLFAMQDRAILDSPVTVSAIRVDNGPPGKPVEVNARFPNGRVEHLLWLLRFDPRWNRSYHYRRPLRLPLGTRLIVSPPGAALSLLLLAQPRGW